MADGDAPPERFDHERTLTEGSVFRDTHPNVLRTNGFDFSTSRSQIAVPVEHRSARLPSPLAAWPTHHEPKRTGLQGCRRRFFDIHKFRSRPNLGLLHVKAVASVHHFRLRIPAALTQLASASISDQSGMQMQPSRDNSGGCPVHFGWCRSEGSGQTRDHSPTVPDAPGCTHQRAKGAALPGLQRRSAL